MCGSGRKFIINGQWWVRVVRSIFWMGGVGWTFFMDEWG